LYRRTVCAAALAALLGLAGALLVRAGQAPFGAAAPDIPISARDRVYTADQYSNTVSVYNPRSETLLGVIRLGDPAPKGFSPLYRGQLLVHGLGFAPDHRTLVVVSIGSNSVTFIDTATNAIKHITYVGRAPHEAFVTPDGREVWVTVRGENYVAVLDAHTYQEKARIMLANGPGMTIFRPDGAYAFVCSSFVPQTAVIAVRTHRVVATVRQASPFCPNIAATPDGRQVWFTLKDTGKVEVISARPPFNVLTVLDAGPITNHVNIVRNARGQFAYVTVGGEDRVKVYTTAVPPRLVATIPTGELPHGIWPSGDGRRVYVALENGDGVLAIDTLTNKVIATIHGAQSPQALVYVPNAVPRGAGRGHLTPLGAAGLNGHLVLGPPGSSPSHAPTSVTVNNQGPIDLLEAAVTGLRPGSMYALALARQARAPYGALQPLATFQTNPAGVQVVVTLGPLRQVVEAPSGAAPRRYLVIAPLVNGRLGAPVQVQLG
jgi:YVTN family beta-propeller protein